MKNFINKMKNKMTSGFTKLYTSQRGEIPYWVNVLAVIVIIVVIAIGLFRLLFPTLSANMIGYIEKLFKEIF